MHGTLQRIKCALTKMRSVLAVNTQGMNRLHMLLSIYVSFILHLTSLAIIFIFFYTDGVSRHMVQHINSAYNGNAYTYSRSIFHSLHKDTTPGSCESVMRIHTAHIICDPLRSPPAAHQQRTQLQSRALVLITYNIRFLFCLFFFVFAICSPGLPA